MRPINSEGKTVGLENGFMVIYTLKIYMDVLTFARLSAVVSTSTPEPSGNLSDFTIKTAKKSMRVISWISMGLLLKYDLYEACLHF